MYFNIEPQKIYRNFGNLGSLVLAFAFAAFAFALTGSRAGRPTLRSPLPAWLSWSDESVSSVSDAAQSWFLLKCHDERCCLRWYA